MEERSPYKLCCRMIYDGAINEFNETMFLDAEELEEMKLGLIDIANGLVSSGSMNASFSFHTENGEYVTFVLTNIVMIMTNIDINEKHIQQTYENK